MKPTLVGFSPAGIGLGCATFGREIDEAASFALMDHALERGVAHFDTAAAYSAGGSEQVVGRWLTARRPQGLTVATKLLPPYDPAQLAGQLELSLRRLGLEAVDLLYLHQWHDSAVEPATLAALDGLVRAGKVRWLGASNFNAAQLTTARERQVAGGLARFQVVQNNHNYAVSDLNAAFAGVCAAQELAIVTYSPLGAGFLTGKHRGGVQAGSRFELIPGHQAIYFKDAPRRRLDRLEAVAARHGHPSAHLALAWALHSQPPHTVLIGGRNGSHLDQAYAARGLNDPRLFAELDGP